MKVFFTKKADDHFSEPTTIYRSRSQNFYAFVHGEYAFLWQLHRQSNADMPDLSLLLKEIASIGHACIGRLPPLPVHCTPWAVRFAGKGRTV